MEIVDESFHAKLSAASNLSSRDVPDSNLAG